jgi:hypothetical protein
MFTNAMVDSWNIALHEQSQLLAWEGTPMAQVYMARLAEKEY